MVLPADLANNVRKMTGGASLNANITQHINIDARGADASIDAKIRAGMEQSRQATLSDVLQHLRRGGVLMNEIKARI